jgi:DNA replication initiation complex subunit (GINS family)
MEDRMIAYIKNLTEEEKLLYCRKQITATIKDFKAKEKAMLAEFNHSNGSFKRTSQNRGGKTTTLSARATSNAQTYFSSVESLKLIVKYL